MIERKGHHVIGLIVCMSFLRLCFRPLGLDNYSATRFRPNVLAPTDYQGQYLGNFSSTTPVFADNQALPLGDSSSTTPQPGGNWKNLPLHFNKSKSGCFRHCQHRRNKIVFYWYPGGLDDRRVLLQGLADLAGYLCAVLEVPRPKFLLHRRHNGGSVMNISATWNDFFNITFRQDGSPSLVDLVNTTSIDERPDPSEIYGGEDYRDWYLVASKNGVSDVVNEFLQLEDYAFRQPPDATAGFIWILQRNYYAMRRSFNESKLIISSSPKTRVGNASRELPPLEMLPLSPIGCSYQQNVAPLYIQNLARDMFEHIQQQAGPSSVVGSFHIRRGDAKNQCDTKLQRMKSYLQCSFNGTESRNMTVLFRSDEREQPYRSAIQTMIHDLGHTYVDLDALIITYLKEAVKRDGGSELRLSNYYVYALSQELITKVSFQLKQHRKDECDDCNKLAGRAYLWKWGYY